MVKLDFQQIILNSQYHTNEALDLLNDIISKFFLHSQAKS